MRLLQLLSLGPLLAAGCFADHGNSITTPPAETDGGSDAGTDAGPGPLAFDATVAIAAVSLAEECGFVMESPDCGPDPSPEGGDSGAGSPPEDADRAPCAPGECCGWTGCQQSTITLSIVAEGERSADFRVLRGTLLTSEGQELVSLNVVDPRAWDGEEYGAWDEVVAPPADLRVLYDLRDLNWAEVYEQADGLVEPWRTTYQVRLVVEIDGEERVLLSGETTREAPVAT